MNEFAMMFDHLEIPTNEVLEAAKTKWNFIDYKSCYCQLIMKQSYIPDLMSMSGTLFLNL